VVSPLDHLALPPGVELRASRYLGTSGPPTLEPERFSGGVNLSAAERNRKRVDEAYRLYGVATMPGVLFGAPWLVALIERELRRG